jgi:nucleoside-diphosphate-sugar epimerase
MGLRHVVPELLQRAYQAEPGGELEVFSADHTRTFCYVDDAVELIHRLAEADAGRNGTFNVGAKTGETTIRALAEIVVRVAGKPLTIKPGPITAGSPARRCPDLRRVVAAAAYEPSVTLEDGVRRTFEWYRTHVFDRPGAMPSRGSGASRAGSD